ncbi:MAG: protein kinase, partial [Thermoanaerobaculia bacterium]
MKTDTEPISETASTIVAPATGRTGRPALVTTREPESVRRRGPGLAMKFFGAAALLVVLTLGTAIAIAAWRANQVAEKSIREALSKVPAVLAVSQRDIETQLKSTVHSIADEPGTKELLARVGVDGPEAMAGTIHEWTSTKAVLLKAKAVFLFDRTGALLARSDKGVGEDQGRPFGSVRWVADPIQSWNDASATIREGKIISTVASSAVVSGDRAGNEGHFDGVLAAAIPFDDARARVLRGLMGGQVGILANTARRGEAPHPELSAGTDGLQGPALVQALFASGPALDTLFVNGKEIGPIDATIEGDRRLIAAVPIKSAAGETLGAFVVSRSRDEETAAFREIRTTLLAIGLASLLLAIPISLLLGRRIARPLEQLAAGAVAIRDGQLDVPLPEGGSDEVGALARAFRAMVGELKEKAQLEEMVAEMQRRPGDVTRRTSTGSVSPDPTHVPGQGPVLGQLFSNRYEVLSTLGKGGMGAVYRALDRELDEEVALKVLTPEAFEEGTLAVQTLKQEIRLARKITHPNVVRTHDLGESEGTRFLTMEYVPGTTLREVVDRKGSLALAPGLQIAKQLCRGLAAVHEAGIIHRDIKPHNIMVLPNGVVKLMDFGIARVADSDEVVTPGGQTVGTPYYMSPEQARGENLDVRSDLYSVGVVLYEIFTGVRPIEGKTSLDVMRGHVTVEPQRPTLLRPDL